MGPRMLPLQWTRHLTPKAPLHRRASRNPHSGEPELVPSLSEGSLGEEPDDRLRSRSSGHPSQEVSVLKVAMNEHDTQPRQMRELLMRLIYCEMLGYDASFGYFKAVQMTQQHNVFDKKIGYLACSLLLHEDHDLMILLVNAFRNDLRDSNHVIVCAALNTLSRLMSDECVPVITPHVLELLRHRNEFVRKKAVMVLYRIWQRSPEAVPQIGDNARVALCDKDPAVMGASLCLLSALVKKDPKPYKDLVSSFVNILKQITEHRLNAEFDYHRMPAPWMQISILKILALLGADDQHASEGMYEILNEVMKRADSGINIGHAVIYECVRTISSIYPSAPLLESASSSIARFITSENHNLKYLGITALAQIVQLDPHYVGNHQMIIIDCLEDPDETLKRKTLDLLYRISNPNNVQLVTEKLLASLESCITAENSDDVHWKRDLIQKITALAENYAPSNTWYLDVINKVFESGGNLVPDSVCDNLLQLIAEGTGEDEDLDNELREYAVTSYLDMAEKTTQLADPAIRVIAWVLGEFGPILEGIDPDTLLERLCSLMETPCERSETRHCILLALMKVSARMGDVHPAVASLVERFAQSRDIELQERCLEFRQLFRSIDALGTALPPGSSTDDIEVDVNLSFLNEYVASMQQRYNLAAYIPPSQRDPMLVNAHLLRSDPTEELKFTAYPDPTEAPSSAPTFSTPADTVVPGGESERRLQTVHVETEALSVGSTRSKWGPQGYNEQLPAAPASDNPPPYELPGWEPPASSPASSLSSSESSPAVSMDGVSPVELAKPTPLAVAAEMPVAAPPMSEKERLASALFGGAAPATTPPRRGGRSSRASRAARPAPEPVPLATTTASAPAPEPELISLGGLTSTPAPPTGDTLDFAGMTLIGAAPAAPAPAPAAAPPAELDLSSLIAAGAPAPAPAQPAASPMPMAPVAQAAPAASPGADILSLFDAMPSSAPAMGTPAPAAAPVVTAGASKQEAIAAYISKTSQFPRSTPHPAPCMQPTPGVPLGVSAFALWKPSELAYAIFVSNESPSTTYNDVCVNLTTPPQSMAQITSLTCDNLPATPQGPAACSVAALRPGEAATLVCTCAYGGMAPVGSIEAALQTREGVAATFSVPVHMADLIRPTSITTAQFGDGWRRHTCEHSFRMQSQGARTCPDFMQRAKAAHFHQVEIRGTQCIVATTLVRTDFLCLVHCRLSPTGVLEFKVRSKDARYSEAVGTLCKEVFA
eukprot:gnl/Trimastix_PCT/1262.p1 GENE.gnl/Trimastix_PCT/1262~~gnl/Trimastix_PCT/1262.p1  ORF type:complete len:1232 (+),score=412.84 gnl/Trimastix_PCT/1262:1785-5480(+)